MVMQGDVKGVAGPPAEAILVTADRNGATGLLAWLNEQGPTRWGVLVDPEPIDVHRVVKNGAPAGVFIDGPSYSSATRLVDAVRSWPSQVTSTVLVDDAERLLRRSLEEAGAALVLDVGGRVAQAAKISVPPPHLSVVEVPEADPQVALTSESPMPLLLNSDSPEAREYAALLGVEAENIAAIVQNMIVAAAADGENTDPMQTFRRTAAVELGEAAADAIASLPAEIETNFDVELEPVTALVDPNRTRRIIRNLISNAVRFGGGTVAVRSYQVGQTAVVTVADNGPGLSDHQLAIFNSATADSLLMDMPDSDEPCGLTGSLGPGLPVSRKLAQLMGGELEYSRDVDVTVFTVSLPAGGRSEQQD